MLDGIFHVRFSSNTQDFGEGIAVFKAGSVNGGDHGYIYKGHIKGSSANLSIEQWNRAVPSVFGPLGNFTLDLTLTSETGENFTATGSVNGKPGLQINITGRKVSPAA